MSAGGLSPRSKHILIGTAALLFGVIVLFAAVPATISNAFKWSSSTFKPLLSSFKQQPVSACSTQAQGATEKPLTILHYIDKKTSDSLMDRWFARSQAQFARNTQIVADAPLWGPGFPDYDSSLSLTANIKEKYGRENYFDAILPYYNGDQVQWLHTDPTPMFRNVKELSVKGGTIVMDRPHEMRDGRRVPIMELANVTIELCPYAHECLAYRNYATRTLLVHQPHPVETALFEHPIVHQNGTVADRPRDVILAGSLEPGLYPLRARLGELIRQKEIPGWIRPHPGYPDIMTDEWKAEHGVDLAFLEKQLSDFADDLAQSKICFVTSSRWGYSVQKYGEAAAAGCLMIGTIPLDRQADMAQFIVPISNNDTDEHILETINFWLDPANEQLRLEKTIKAQRYFLSQFSGDHYVADVVRWIRAAQSGQRGLILPYEFDTLPMEPTELPNDG